MASSPTGSSGLEKQGTGENTNAWGVRLNTSLDLIDEMVNGVAGNTVTTSFALTITNYASSDGRKMVQRLTGSPAADFTITLPARFLVRVFHNLSGKTATITNGTGATCTVRTGTMAIVYSDTTNGCFVDDETLDKVKLAAASLDLNSQKIINLLPPTDGTDAANKNYVDTFTAARSAGGFKLTNLANGTATTDAVNKQQLDAATFGASAIPSGSAVGQVPVWNGTGYAPGAVDLADADAKTGLLPLANGGTGAGTAAGARSAVLGDAAANSGKVIVSNGSDWLPGTVSAQRSAKTGAYTVISTDSNSLIDCTNSFTLSLTAAATLAANFSFSVRNSGTGVITIDPNSTELIDGLSTILVYPGEAFDVFCTGSAFITKGRQKGWVYLGQSVVGSAVSSVDLTLGLSDAEIRSLEVSVEGMLPSATGSRPAVRVSKSATYITSYTGTKLAGGAASALSAVTEAQLGYQNSADTVSPTTSIVRISNVRANMQTIETYSHEASQNDYATNIIYARPTAGAIDGVRFLFLATNIAAGTFRVFGLRS